MGASHPPHPQPGGQGDTPKAALFPCPLPSTLPIRESTMKLIGARRVLAITVVLLFVSGCDAGPEIKIGDCLIPNNGNTPENIVQVVSATPTEYKVFTSFLSNGQLIQAKDYQPLEANKASSSYSKVACPAFAGSFSPDAYLNKKQ